MHLCRSTLALLTLLLCLPPTPTLAAPPPPSPLLPRNKVIGPSLSPAQSRKLSSLKSQYASLRHRTALLASSASSLASAQRAASRSLSLVSRAGASLEAVASPSAAATASPARPPASGCASPNQVAAPGPIGPQDPTCVPLCFPEALDSGGPTFARAVAVLRPGSNAACRARCRADKLARDVDIAYYAVGQPFSYSSGFFSKGKGQGVACHCIVGTELKARVKLAGKGKGCGGKAGGSGGEASVAVYAIDPDSI